MMIFENVGGDEVMLKIDWGKKAQKTPEEIEYDNWFDKYHQKFGEAYGINPWEQTITRAEAIDQMKNAIKTGVKIKNEPWENTGVIQ